MTGAWRKRGGHEHAVPVELRFIDLYMAALGALLFLAMLLAYLLPNVPKPNAIRPAPSGEKQALTIATTSLPMGVVGIPYQAAIAYRGGTGSVAWTLTSGAADLPGGVTFDNATGIFAGVAATARTSRVVVRATDSSGALADQPYEIAFQTPPAKVDRAAWWVVLLSFIAALAYALGSYVALLNARTTVKNLNQSYASGQRVVEFKGGNNVIVRIELPEGIGTYEQFALAAKRKFQMTAVVAAALGVYLGYLAFIK